MTRIGVALAILVATTVALARERSGSDREIIRLASEMQFKEASPGVWKAVLWGDPTRGPYGTINRFSKGTRSGLHTHSHDIEVVVISGTFVYDSGTGEKRLGPGSYLFEPAGLKHTAGAGEDADRTLSSVASRPAPV
jgi:quercetin dioxygenase-like cupin family protein